LLAPPLAHADFYRWKDAEGITHYVQDIERVPRRYRGSVEVVRPRAGASKGALPVLDVHGPPRPDEAGFEEPGLGERAPTQRAGQVSEPVGHGGPGPGPQPSSPDVDPRQAEIAELERELEARRAELKSLISQTSFDSSQIASDPRLRELAEVVPRLQAELDALRGELER
jgi:hypothetical protein